MASLTATANQGFGVDWHAWRRKMRTWKEEVECFRAIENGLQYKCVNMSHPSSSLRHVPFQPPVNTSSTLVSIYGKPVNIPPATRTRKTQDCTRLWRNILLVAIFLSHVNPAFLQTTEKNSEIGVCGSMDIRNRVNFLQELSGCRVIEGYLQISLMDSYPESTFFAHGNYSFPELREITGYLLLFRVHGLRSLGDLFPNLAVIRGEITLQDYALIIYYLKDLEEIGLYSLTDISRGSVRIEQNDLLCYANTIDWDMIACNGKGGNLIKENKSVNECLYCPVDDGGTSIGRTITNVCPSATGKNDDPKRRLCWNNNNCQKVCPNCPKGYACSPGGKCCDKSCLGGCSDDSITECTVCRELYIGQLDSRQCISSCPANYYKYRDRRCITKNECLNMGRPKEINEKEFAKKPFKPINGTCMLHCPPNYYEEIDQDKERSKCKPCNGPCTRECYGKVVDSIQTAQELAGCTYMKGTLKISVRGGGNVYIVKELEKGLGLITDIQGALIVERSYPLITLDFLKSLRRIHGLDGNNTMGTSFSVSHNQNLQDLWDWKTHGDIEILHGNLSFYLNPKLCYQKIQVLKRMAKESTFSKKEIKEESNGDKIACNITQLDITHITRHKESAVINWESFVYEDPRSLLGYVIYSTEAPYKNVTLYEGRDACGHGRWNIKDKKKSDDDDGLIFVQLIAQLKPYTQYAVYVETYTIATERLGARSKIEYFTTLPGQPSPPRITEISSSSPNSLFLRWLPPEKPNGNVTQYRITVQQEEDKESMLHQRNYCIDPSTSTPEEKKSVVEIEKTKQKDIINSESGCACDSFSSNTQKEEDKLDEINFQDLLMNYIYMKRSAMDTSRRRRDLSDINLWIGGSPIEFPSNIGEDNNFLMEEDFKTKEEGGFYHSYYEVLGNQTSFNISKLHHYEMQTISLWACREIDPDELKEPKEKIQNCSVRTTIRHRTAKLPGADDITDLLVHIEPNSTSDVVFVTWTEPEFPNGLILTYYIQYRREDIENHAYTTECVTRQEFLNTSKLYMIKNLSSGNYSIRVMANSQAGKGNYSENAYFYILNVESNKNIILGGFFVGVLLLVVVYVVLKYLICNLPKSHNLPKTLFADVNPEYMSAIYVPDEWEVLRSDIELIQELGQGSFGMVYEGIAKNLPKASQQEIRCAVKTVNEHATEKERIDFLKEASVMKAFDTPHVVRLLGVVSLGLPSLVIMELMSNGDLKTYLRLHRLDIEKPTLTKILQMAMQIADGMAYLSAKKFVHRDLAARNCMVTENLTVKVGDFGMTRDIYETDYYRKGTKGFLPVRWMSPESLSDGVYSSSTDVWSFGVVLWEMSTLASQPYQGLSNDQVVRYVMDGGVMERPENCPDKLYGLMQLIWKQRPDARPTFLQLVSILSSEATDEFRQNSFFFSPEGQDIYHQVLPAVIEEVTQMTPTANEELLSSICLKNEIYPQAASLEHNSTKSPFSIIKNISPPGVIKGDLHEMEPLMSPSTTEKTVVSSKSTSPLVPNGFLVQPNIGNPNVNPSRC